MSIPEYQHPCFRQTEEEKNHTSRKSYFFIVLIHVFQVFSLVEVHLGGNRDGYSKSKGYIQMYKEYCCHLTGI